MIITKKELEEKGFLEFSSDDEIKADDLNLIEGFVSLKKVHCEAKIRYGQGLEVAIVSLKVKGTLVLKSTRSLKPVDYDFDEEDELTFSFSNDEELTDEDIIALDNDEISLHEHFVSLIVSSIPYKVVGKDEPESIKGDNWEVLSEDEYSKRKENDIDPRFAALADLDLDD
jgi:uncharacterized protein